MGDLHMTIVNDVGKVICRETVALDDNEVVLGEFVLEPAVDDVLDQWRCLGALEADGELLSVMGTLIRLLRRDMPTCARIEDWLPGLVGSSFELLQLLGRAEAPIRLTFAEEHIGVLLVQR
jgi:hypothetical protein